MTPLITPADMRDMEKRFFRETGTESIELMETAAEALCRAILARYGSGRTIYFACGPGGNGGDGYACARMLRARGIRAFIAPAGEPTSPDAIENLRRARAAGVADAPAERPDVWVDALYGTGLSRAPSGESEALIRRMNADRAQGSAVAAVDIPSGLSGMTGAAFDPCVGADVTFTFQYAKPGCFLADGLDAAGEVQVLDIGIPAEYYPAESPALVDEAMLHRILPPRKRNMHKGTAGHLLIVAGSVGMAGAAALCALSALRSGAGLVTVACPGSILPVLQTLAPCAMAVPLPEWEGAISDEAVQALEAILPGKRAVVCGCGLSQRTSEKVVAAVLDCGLPALLDADALNLISKSDALKARLRPHHLLTPHPGEAARLLGRALTDPIQDALALRELGAQALLKGTASVVAIGRRAVISRSGASGMAKGGSGDCLSGLIGGLLAQAGAGLTGEALAEQAAAGSEIHGLAGEIACAEHSSRGMTALDLIKAIPEALKPYD